MCSEGELAALMRPVSSVGGDYHEIIRAAMPLIAGSGSEPVQHVCDRILQAVLERSPVPDDDVAVLVARHRARPTAHG